MVAGDFNGDGKLDLAVADGGNGSLDGTDPVRESCWAMATGRSSPRSTYAAGISPESLVAGDFSGDGKLDLAVADPGDINDGTTGGVSF